MSRTWSLIRPGTGRGAPWWVRAWPSRRTPVGLATGLTVVVVVVQVDGRADGSLGFLAAAPLVAAVLAWTVGELRRRRTVHGRAVGSARPRVVR